ncbi:DNA-binding MarR family transcriptional regulator [Nakamurella sp. UYEF19]|uniref:MarR family winged helix-turn-helix transcriptional regulator n=1 Tax=Nakamurella sp. UYEF19 TaxID=1756392 RepID=UPI0033977E2F
MRPVHGFAFGVLSEGPTTTSGLAAALGTSKQAAAQLVDHLVQHGYLTRESDARDRRAQLLVVTARGHACTAAAEQSAAEVVQSWRESVPAQAFPVFVDVLHGIARPGRLRPAW